MKECFFTEKSSVTLPIFLIKQADFPGFLAKQNETSKAWLTSSQFRAEPGAVRLVPDANGKAAFVVCVMADAATLWSVGHLPYILPEGDYHLEQIDSEYAIAWGLGAYQFNRYKKPQRLPAKLFLPAAFADQVNQMVQSICLVRDWVNTPTDDLGPSEFAQIAKQIASEFGAEFSEIKGEALLKENYASIYTVGRASDDAPRLVDLRWGNPLHPKITLVGKGVCFDSGGLDIKSSQHMLLMKKDMAGGAHALGLARMMMAAKLPVRLRVLIPMVENVISGNAYRPGDVIKSRKGLTIEVGNTDAEGRVILADALTEAVSEKPDLLIDMTTLTGAARVALGTELPAVFSNNDALVNDVIKFGEKTIDPMWRLPLFPLYREYINSQIADLNNNSSEPYAGAITAALFLKEFVPDEIPWLHFDMMAWNLRARPGRPSGGEAMCLRALFAYIQTNFSSK
jgi:leucyl aminopeptidase